MTTNPENSQHSEAAKERCTLGDLIAVQGQLEEMLPLMDDDEWNHATGAQVRRVAGFLDREIARRMKARRG